MDKVSSYIRANWEKTFHPSSELIGEREDKLPLCIAVRNGCIYGNLLLGYIFHQSRAYARRLY